MRPGKPLIQVLAVGAVLIMLALVLSPSSATPSSAVSGVSRTLTDLGAPPWLADDDLWERALNVLLFVPVGVIGVLVMPRWPWLRWALVGFLISGCIELFQGVVLPARDASVSDILTNTLGAGLGAWVTTRVMARRR